MFDQPGIGVEDLPWIHRDQFIHYVYLAHALGDQGDWPGLREDLAKALTAAFGLDAGIGHEDPSTPEQRQVLELLDEIRCQHDPATHWPAFLDMLWSRRDAIRPDLV